MIWKDKAPIVIQIYKAQKGHNELLYTYNVNWPCCNIPLFLSEEDNGVYALVSGMRFYANGKLLKSWTDDELIDMGARYQGMKGGYRADYKVIGYQKAQPPVNKPFWVIEIENGVKVDFDLTTGQIYPLAPVMVYSPDKIPPKDDIDMAIDRLFRRFGRPGQENYSQKIVSLGDSIVPRLIAKYKSLQKIKGADVRPLVQCLLGISSDQALAFCRQILQDYQYPLVFDLIVKKYPISSEEQLIQPLIALAANPNIDEQHYSKVQARLSAIIRRDPSKASLLIVALKDDPAYERYDKRLRLVLDFIFGPPERVRIIKKPEFIYDNDMWRVWWDNNKDKLFDWAVSLRTYSMEESYALMVSLKDKRAIPVLLSDIDSQSQIYLRYQAALVLKSFEGDVKYDSGETFPMEALKKSYTMESFERNEKQIVRSLKERFAGINH